MIPQEELQTYAADVAHELELIRSALSRHGFKMASCLLGVAAAALLDEASRRSDPFFAHRQASS